MDKQETCTDQMGIENVSAKRRLNLNFSRFSRVSETTGDTDWVLWEAVKQGNEKKVREYFNSYSIKILLLELTSVLDTYDDYFNIGKYDTCRALARLSGISLLASELAPKVTLTVTLFHMAIMERQPSIVRLFMEKLVMNTKEEDKNIVIEDLKKSVVLSIPGDLNKYSKDDVCLDGMNAFHLAAKYSIASLNMIFRYLNASSLMDETSIKDLLETKDKHLQQTPLHIAAKNCSTEATR